MQEIASQQQQSALTHCDHSLMSDLRKGRTGKPIIALGDRDLLITLAYCIEILGVNKVPDDMQKKIIINYLRKYFGTTTPEEIRLAFELAIAGQLDLSEKDVIAYENFSCIYIAKILNAYKRFFNNNYEPEKVEVKLLPPPNFNPLDLVNMFYKEFLRDEINWQLVSSRAYDIAVKHCDMGLSEADLKLCIAEAKRDVQMRITDELYKLNTEKNLGKISQLRQVKDLLQTLPIETACSNDEVNHVAKVKCLKLWFERIKKQGFKVVIKNR